MAGRLRKRADNGTEGVVRWIDFQDSPAECSGPPHLLGPWGSAGTGAVRVASS